MAKLSTIEKIREAREKVKAAKAKRGRQKGYTHSEATKEKIGEGVSRSKQRIELEDCCKQTEEHLPLEEALEKAVEKYQYCRYVDHKAPAEEIFDVKATSWQERYYAMEQKIVGIQNTIPAAWKLLKLVNAQYVTIRIVVYEKIVGEDGVSKMKKVKDPAYVLIAKEDKEGKRYWVWFMNEEIRKEWAEVPDYEKEDRKGIS